MVIAPEHPFVERLTTPEQTDGGPGLLREGGATRAISTAPIWPRKRRAFSPAPTRSIRSTARRSRFGWPITCSISYGTGAIMAVPAHDDARLEFAKQFDLPIITVVDPGESSGVGRQGEGHATRGVKLRAGRTEVAFIADGTAINSGPYNGLTTPEFKKKIAEDLTEGHRPRGGQLQAPRLALQPAAFLGRAVPDLARVGRRRQPTGRDSRAGAGRSAAGPAGEMKFDAKHDEPDAAVGQGPGRLALCHARRKALQARDEHDAAMGRLVLVLPAIPRSEERPRPWSIRKSKRRGCRSIFTSAGRSMPCCTCSTPDSGTRCSSIAAT